MRVCFAFLALAAAACTTEVTQVTDESTTDAGADALANVPPGSGVCGDVTIDFKADESAAAFEGTWEAFDTAATITTRCRDNDDQTAAREYFKIDHGAYTHYFRTYPDDASCEGGGFDVGGVVAVDAQGVIKQCAETYETGGNEATFLTVEIFSQVGTQVYTDPASAFASYQFMRAEAPSGGYARMSIGSTSGSDPLTIKDANGVWLGFQRPAP